MGYKRDLIKVLDRPGGRWLLGWAATHLAKRAAGADVRVYYDRMWMHEVDGVVFPDGHAFSFFTHLAGDWANEAQACLDNAEDYWYRHYKPRPGDVVVDVGAGRGEDVLAFSRDVGNTGRVIAIEAFPASFMILEAFCRANRMTNVVPVQAALMDRLGSVCIEPSGDWQANSVAVHAGAPAGVSVPATTLEILYAELALGEIAFLKMNIEGAERYALPGMGAIMDRVKTICVACHDFRADRGDGEQYRTRVFVEDFLSAHGFRLESSGDDLRPYVRDHVFGFRSGLGRSAR